MCSNTQTPEFSFGVQCLQGTGKRGKRVLVLRVRWDRVVLLRDPEQRSLSLLIRNKL